MIKINQPNSANNWLNDQLNLDVSSSIPPGLEYFNYLDEIIVDQLPSLYEAITGHERNNKYSIKNINGIQIFFAVEGCCWFAGLCTHCAHELVVESPVGRPIGYVIQNLWKSSFSILDDNRNIISLVEGPWCTLDGPFCPVDNEFKVLDIDGVTQIGKITKNYSGLIKEAFTNSDNFSITFPPRLHPKAKATLLAALFLIDFMFFEEKSEDQNN